ncbi:MAG: GGDEF domain-containing protein [Nitrospinae bacterium]|nr:GGDEF domain-containing protein [Nitrospinota bacterium]
MVDSLTNVLNRNAYNLKITQLVREFKRYKEKWALLVLDIDHFKKFNDKYGHKTGDQVLKKKIKWSMSKTNRAHFSLYLLNS